MTQVLGRQLDSDDMSTVFEKVAEFHAESRYPVIFDFEPNPVQVIPVLGRRALDSLTELRASSEHAEEQYQRYMTRPVSKDELVLTFGLILYMGFSGGKLLDSEKRILAAANKHGYVQNQIQKLSLPLNLAPDTPIIDRKFVRWLGNNGIDDVKLNPPLEDVAWTTLLGESRRSEGMFKPRMALMGKISRAISEVRAGPIEVIEVPETIA